MTNTVVLRLLDEARSLEGITCMVACEVEDCEKRNIENSCCLGLPIKISKTGHCLCFKRRSEV